MVCHAAVMFRHGRGPKPAPAPMAILRRFSSAVVADDSSSQTAMAAPMPRIGARGMVSKPVRCHGSRAVIILTPRVLGQRAELRRPAPMLTPSAVFARCCGR